MTQDFGMLVDRDAARKIYVMLRALPRTTTSTCECGIVHTQSSLQIYPKCDKCGEYDKIYSLGAGLDLQDLIKMILGWAGVPEDWQDSIPIHPEDDQSEEWTRWDTYFKVTPEEIEAMREYGIKERKD